MAGKRKIIDEHDLQGFKYFKKLSSLVEHLHDAGCARDRAGNRKLHMDQYCLLVLCIKVVQHSQCDLAHI